MGTAAVTSKNKYKGGPRKEYFCTKVHELNLRDDHGYPLNNFIGYGDNSKESPLQLKTTKKWCPLKEENKNDNNLKWRFIKS